MTMKRKALEMLAFCPVCRSVQVRLDDGKLAWQKSICEFPNLPQTTCYGCVEKPGDMGISENVA